MRNTILLIALVLTVTVLASAAENRHGRFGAHPDLVRGGQRVHWYSRTDVPQGWTKLQAAQPDEQLKFTVILKGSNADELERRFWAVSDPHSSEYGHFMTNAAIEQLVAPSASEWAQLLSTLSLSAHGGIAAEQLSSHGDSFTVHCSVQQAEALFATTFYHFVHVASGGRAVRQWGEYWLPAALAEQTELVLDVHTFPTHEQRRQMKARREGRRQRASEAAAAAAAPTLQPAWIPSAMSALYGVPCPITPLADSEISAGVIEWSQQYFNETDLQEFAVQTETAVRNVSAYHVVGNGTGYAGDEASLDIQWLEGINPGSTPWFWEVPDPLWMWSFALEFLTALDYPQIISLSYGLPEAYQCDNPFVADCNGLSYPQYIRAVDKQFMKIGLLGVSILVCSQDEGVYLPVDADADIFAPAFPATSAYVTAVGATEMSNPVFNVPNPPPACNTTTYGWTCISHGTEQAVSLAIAQFLSGGGFSNVTARPAYQSAAVEGYFQSGVSLPAAGLWNRSGRGFPDVSAIGYGGFVVQGGVAELLSGTSMSTPIVAAIIALVAHDYYAITKQPLGFLNPTLYSAQAAGAGLFKDITIGDNCATPECGGQQQDGFKCAKGWDPITGLGTPVYPAMKAYYTALAETVVARRQ